MQSPPSPLPLTRAQVREVDRLAIEELGLPGVVLMENAGHGAARIGLELLRERDATSALVVCGGGNNDGDGFVVARHLALAGVRVLVAASQHGARARGDAAVMRRVVERMGIELAGVGEEAELERLRQRTRAADEPPALVVDALLGTGFEGPVRADVARAIELIAELRTAGAIVLALDLPSGLDCDTGRPARPTVRADRTATFVAPKVGFAADAARHCLGRVDVVPIGVPASLVEKARATA